MLLINLFCEITTIKEWRKLSPAVTVRQLLGSDQFPGNHQGLGGVTDPSASPQTADRVAVFSSASWQEDKSVHFSIKVTLFNHSRRISQLQSINDTIALIVTNIYFIQLVYFSLALRKFDIISLLWLQIKLWCILFSLIIFVNHVESMMFVTGGRQSRLILLSKAQRGC